MRASRNTRGFTLVELAIVLTIIGLLIAGILQGKRLFENSRIASQIAQFQAIQAADITFKDKYSQRPGDLSNATQRLPGCTAANFCQDGNSDSNLGADTLAANQWYIEDQSAINTERTQYWRHLLLADMIGGTNIGNTVAWGQSHPMAPLGAGGLQIARGTSPVNTGIYFLRLQRSVMGQPVAGAGGQAVSPHAALVIDEKIDDGQPNAGIVRAINPNVPGVCESVAGNAYVNGDSSNCLFFFQLDK